ncbi:MAG: galactose mutarotase [Propionibacteriaceae bacterium]|jgi:aldose 1-epimerase|nr:galactose mutarotase [Propionibacteriaceae bacterium]
MSNAAYFISNDDFEAEILPFGATLQALKVRGRNVVLGRENLTAQADGYLGATVGRYPNRIGGAEYSYDGETYYLDANEGQNMLHGGAGGWSLLTWDVLEVGQSFILLGITSADGDQGFPGNVTATAKFELLDNGLQVTYTATTDKATPLGMTNHVYFNLSDEPTIDNHTIQLNASGWTPTDDEGIPLGNIDDFDDTGLDMSKPRKIAEVRADATEHGSLRGPGIDNNFVIAGSGLRDMAAITSPDGSLAMAVRSNAPCLQVYDGNMLKGQPWKQFAGVALEAQPYVDAPNQDAFPPGIVKPGERYEHVIQWLFA